MVYLINTRGEQEVLFPGNAGRFVGDVDITFVSTIDRTETYLGTFGVLYGDSDYFAFRISLPEIDPGEYEYTLTELESENVLATGLLVITETFGHIEYDKTIEYEQYNAK